MDNTYTIATVFLLIAVQIAQGKPSDSQLCVQVTVCGHDGKIYPTPCDAPSFPPPCYDYKRITKGSCICEDDNPCSHGTPLTNWSGIPLVCGGRFHPVGTKFDRCPKDFSCNFKFAAFDGPALCCPKEPICKSCGSIVKGQRCGQDGGPYRLNCTQCCQSSSSKCAEWRCDAGGWLCQKSCSTGNGGGLEKCPRGNPLAGVFCGRGPHRQNCPKGYFCNTDPADRFAICCPDGEECDQDINECASDPCGNGGTCLDEIGKYTCQCLDGWTGVNCTEDVDECEETQNICNFGICVNKAGTFECYCRPGYSGERCASESDECLSTPCQNNGTCHNEVNKYRCECIDGFNGTDCENNIDECEGDPCKFGATCIDGIADYTCSCLAGYTGRNCSINIDDCELDPCLHGGACLDGINEYTCNCSNTGFKGVNCSEDIDECEVLPCQNNATCVDKINDYDCTCFDGYEGKNCETDIKECDNEPCENGGTCYEKSNRTLYSPDSIPTLLPEGKIREHFSHSFTYDRAGGYLCKCVPGYTDDNCETDINECESQPCFNEATCTDQVDNYTCSCKPGYDGRQCENDINECLLNPCQNGASCDDLVADWNCQCTEGFGGKNCSVPLTGCDDVNCFNGGACIPYLVGETDHRANCTCQPGYDGLRCETITTFSFQEGAKSCGPEECGEVCTRGQKCVDNSCYCFRAPCNCPTGPCTHKCVDDTRVIFPQ